MILKKAFNLILLTPKIDMTSTLRLRSCLRYLKRVTIIGGVTVILINNVNAAVTRVSVSSNGTPGNAQSNSSALSADGRFVAFSSFAGNLVADDSNGKSDVFVHDRQTKQTTRVSVSSSGAQGSGYNLPYESGYTAPAISADGRFIVFESNASNLVLNDTNGVPDIFIHDQVTKQTDRVSVSVTGVQGNGRSTAPAISADGRYIAFESNASNLVPNDTNNFKDVFVYDRETGQVNRIDTETILLCNDICRGESYSPAFSSDGRYVVFSFFYLEPIPILTY